MENAENALENEYLQQNFGNSSDFIEIEVEPEFEVESYPRRSRRYRESDVSKYFDNESRSLWHHEIAVSKHIDHEERRRRWRLARSRPAEKMARPASAVVEIQAAGRGGRRASHRVGSAGGGGKKASSGDDGGGGEPPPPLLLTIADLAARWSVACQTIKNCLSKGADLPPAIRLSGARGPRWRLVDVEAFEARAPLYREPAPRPRGRPRICQKGGRS
ncbi:helix-turn-helix transcriptional regulator [Acidiphilium acidophilum]|uniref:Helix-turn-helix domain-containing protein n=1 Tax=Acidiphilium acidophilum TaxID=76588 RepID=A0AAW9DUC7_ACIAO|nr:hypothetical protein [Acidiphilium acidophilum]MDX5931760.1 hypothetical protein [Acidiphilium acidophilum]